MPHDRLFYCYCQWCMLQYKQKANGKLLDISKLFVFVVVLKDIDRAVAGN